MPPGAPMSVCRICLDGPGGEGGQLFSPCACRGSAAAVHEACLLEWCRRKGDFAACGLCHQAYVGPVSVALARARLEQAEKLAEGNLERLKAEHELAKTLDGTGRFEESIKLHRRSLAAFERRRGPEHPDTLAVLSCLAHALGRAGQQLEALKLHRRAYDAMCSSRGEDHAHTLTAGNNLALALCAERRHAEGAEILRRVLAGRTRLLGEEHLDTFNAAGNLAGALSGACCGADAEVAELYRRALAGLRRLLGEEHPNSLKVALNLAIALSNMGRHSEAAECQRKTLAAQKRALGEAHPETVKSAAFLKDLECAAAAAPAKAAGTAAGEPRILAAGAGRELAAAAASGRGPPTPTRSNGSSARKRPRGSCEADEVLALLLQVGVPFEDATGYMPRFIDEGFDSMPALRTLTEADLVRLRVGDRGHRRALLDFLARDAS